MNAVLELLLAQQRQRAIEDNAGFRQSRTRFVSSHTETARIVLQHIKAGLPKSLLPSFWRKSLKAREDAVAMLLSNHADVNAYLPSGSTASIPAAFKGQDAIVRLLTANGADVNHRNRDGTIPLYDAALSGHLTTVAILLAQGAEINAQETQSGTTALYAAASFGHEDVAALLLDKGADPNICSKEGVSPLHVALENGNVGIANRIRQHGGQDFGRPL